jgi:hypothetical protein
MTAGSRSRLRGAFAALAAFAMLALAAVPAPAAAQASTSAKPTVVITPEAQKYLPRVTPEAAIRVAERTPQVRSQRARHSDLRLDIQIYRDSRNWGLGYFSGETKVVDVTIDGDTGRVIGAWQGIKAAWPMARGTHDYFGSVFQSWYVWIPLCLLFVCPFFDPRRPFRLLHLDLLVLVAGFGASHFFFNKGEIGTSVPLVYPVLAYLLARLLIAGFRPRRTGERLTRFPAAYFVVAIIALVGLRIGLDVTSSNVGDVGYGSTIGAYRIQHSEPLYKDSGAVDHHLDTYGPVNYLAYYPFVRVFPPSRAEAGSLGDYKLPAAHAGAIFYDLLTVLGLFLLGGVLRPGRSGRMLGLALAYAWVSYPYTLFALMSNTNDLVISALLVFSLVAIASARGRGLLLALASAAKFAPLALAPLFATGRGEARGRSWFSFGAVFALVSAAFVLPFIPKEGLGVVWNQTIGFQLGRSSPFSVWGQNPSFDVLLTLVKLGAGALALAVAFVPRRRSTAQVAALAAAVLIATQLTAIHWFYFYIVWFTPFALAALFCEYGTGRDREPRPLPATVEIPPLSEPQRQLAGVS